MTLIATEFETGPLSQRVRNQWHAAKLLGLLEREGVQRFPRRARLSRVTKEDEEPAFFTMAIDDLDGDDIVRFRRIYHQLSVLLHEPRPEIEALASETIRPTVGESLRALRADHQWLWNRLWQHANVYGGDVFFVELGDVAPEVPPRVIMPDGFRPPLESLDLDVEAILDCSLTIDWATFPGDPGGGATPDPRLCVCAGPRPRVT